MQKFYKSSARPFFDEPLAPIAINKNCSDCSNEFLYAEGHSVPCPAVGAIVGGAVLCSGESEWAAPYGKNVGLYFLWGNFFAAGVVAITQK